MTETKHSTTLDVGEVAALWGVSKASIYRRAREGTLPVAPLHLGAVLRWPKARVYAVLGLDEDGNLLDTAAGS
jgi:predicted DNA-binding transcriptional regulator AlpA